LFAQCHSLGGADPWHRAQLLARHPRSCCSVGWAKCGGIAQSGGCEVDYQYFRRYPPLAIQFEADDARSSKAAALTVGRENVEPTRRRSPARDFAFMLERSPAPTS